MSQLSSARRSLAAMLLLLAAAAAVTAQAPTPGAACHNDLVALRSACYEYVQGGRPGGGALVPPSPNCCATVKAVRNVPCVCDYLATDFNIDLGRVFYVAGQCGATIPSSCGLKAGQRG